MLRHVVRVLLTVLGAVLGLLGILWILQGINVVPVGFMAGHIQYAVLGLIALVIGALVIFFVNRRPAVAMMAESRARR